MVSTPQLVIFNSTQSYLPSLDSPSLGPKAGQWDGGKKRDQGGAEKARLPPCPPSTEVF